jgi:hypothetical protein
MAFGASGLADIKISYKKKQWIGRYHVSGLKFEPSKGFFYKKNNSQVKGHSIRAVTTWIFLVRLI